MKNGAGLSQIEWLFVAAVAAITVIVLSALTQASVGVANRLTRGGGEQPVPSPGVRRAMLIAFIAMAVESVLNYLIEGTAGVRANGAELKMPDDLDRLAAYGALSLVAGFVAWSCVLAFALPTPFVRAAFVTFVLHVLIVLLAVAVAVPVAAAYVFLVL
jgi:hypothetical protein